MHSKDFPPEAYYIRLTPTDKDRCIYFTSLFSLERHRWALYRLLFNWFWDLGLGFAMGSNGLGMGGTDDGHD
jgi:hypothetical protein